MRSTGYRKRERLNEKEEHFLQRCNTFGKKDCSEKYSGQSFYVCFVVVSGKNNIVVRAFTKLVKIHGAFEFLLADLRDK